MRLLDSTHDEPIEQLDAAQQAILRARLLSMRSGSPSQIEAARLLRAHGLDALKADEQISDRAFRLLVRAGCSPQRDILRWTESACG